MNDLEKHLKSLQVSSATKAMMQGVTVNMENHIDSLRRQFQSELKACCSDFVKYDEAYNDFQRKVDFTQLITRVDKLIRSKVKDIFIYEAEPIFQRLWSKREKQLVGALRQNRRDAPGKRTSSFAAPTTSIANEDVEEIEDRAIDAMSGSAASDMVGLWKMAEALSVGPDLEKLIKSWLGFQAESLQKQANELSRFNEKLEELKKAPAMPARGGNRRGNRGGKSRMQSVAMSDLNDLKNNIGQQEVDFKEQKKRQEELKQQFAIVDEKINQTHQKIEFATETFRKQFEMIDAKIESMNDKMEEFFKQGTSFRKNVQTEVGSIRDEVGALGGDLDDMKFEFEKAQEEKRERREKKQEYYKSERDKIIEQTRQYMLDVENSRRDLLDVGHTIKFEREQMKKIWIRHSEKLESTIKNCAKVLKERSHADMNEAMAKIEDKIWNKMHDIQVSLREDVRSKVSQVKEKLDHESHAINDMNKSLLDLSRLKNTVNDLVDKSDNVDTQLKSLQNSAIKLSSQSSTNNDKIKKIVRSIKNIEQLQNEFDGQQKLSNQSAQTANELLKKQSNEIKQLLKEVKNLSKTTSSKEHVSHIEKSIKQIQRDLIELESSSTKEFKIISDRLDKQVDNQTATLQHVQNVMDNKINEAERKLRGKVDRLAANTGLSQGATKNVGSFLQNIKKKRKKKTKVYKQNEESNRLNQSTRAKHPSRRNQSNEKSGQNDEVKSLSENILSVASEATSTFDNSTMHGLVVSEVDKSNSGLKFIAKENVLQTTDANTLDTVDENVALGLNTQDNTSNAIDTLENAIASEKMWRSSVNEDSKKEEIERELNGKIADPMDVPFFRYWPVLLEMVYPSSLEWQRRLGVRKMKRKDNQDLQNGQEALARVNLQNNAQIQVALLRWWTEMALENKALSKIHIDGSGLTKDKYIDIHNRLLEVLTNNNMTPKDARVIAEDDWDNDSNGKDCIRKKTFMSMVFELAWLFVGDSEVKEYLAFLNAICTSCTGIDYVEPATPKRLSLSDRYNESLNNRAESIRDSNMPSSPPRVSTTGSIVNIKERDHDEEAGQKSDNSKVALYYPPKAKKSWTKRVTYADSEAMSSFRAAVKGPIIYNSSHQPGIVHSISEEDKVALKAEASPDAITKARESAGDFPQNVLSVLEDLHWSHASLQHEFAELKKIGFQKSHVDEMYKTMSVIEKKMSNQMADITKKLDKERRAWEDKQKSVLTDLKISNEALLRELSRQTQQNRIRKGSPYNHNYDESNYNYSPIKGSVKGSAGGKSILGGQHGSLPAVNRSPVVIGRW